MGSGALDAHYRDASEPESPSADPLARWCGRGEGNPPADPIGHLVDSIHRLDHGVLSVAADANGV